MAKYTLKTNDKLDETLEELAKRDGITKAQVIRKAVALMKVAEEHRDQGYELQLFKSGDGDEPAKTKTLIV